MNPTDAVFAVLWAGIFVLACYGAGEHARQWRGYRRWARVHPDHPLCSTIIGWRRDEYYRMVLKCFLALVAGAWGLLRTGAALGWFTGEDVGGIVFRSLGLLGVGGAVVWLSIWRVQVDRERQQRAPNLHREIL